MNKISKFFNDLVFLAVACLATWLLLDRYVSQLERQEADTDLEPLEELPPPIPEKKSPWRVSVLLNLLGFLGVAGLLLLLGWAVSGPVSKSVAAFTEAGVEVGQVWEYRSPDPFASYTSTYQVLAIKDGYVHYVDTETGRTDSSSIGIFKVGSEKISDTPLPDADSTSDTLILPGQRYEFSVPVIVEPDEAQEESIERPITTESLKTI